jgi:hypothetical protein
MRITSGAREVQGQEWPLHSCVDLYCSDSFQEGPPSEAFGIKSIAIICNVSDGAFEVRSNAVDGAMLFGEGANQILG